MREAAVRNPDKVRKNFSGCLVFLTAADYPWSGQPDKSPVVMQIDDQRSVFDRFAGRRLLDAKIEAREKG